MIEKRKFPRIALGVEVHYKVIGQRDLDFLRSQAVNLSPLGVRIFLDKKIETGSLLDIKFFLPDSEMIIIATGRVSWVEEFKSKDIGVENKFEAGVEFIGVNKEDKEFIQEYILGRLK